MVGQTADIWGSVTHHAVIVIADIPKADAIPENDQDIGFAGFCLERAAKKQKYCEYNSKKLYCATEMWFC